MFTGIIEELGIVNSIDDAEFGKKISIGSSNLYDNIDIGGSLSVNGVCLTLVKKTDNNIVEKDDLNLDKNFAPCLGALKIIKDGWETEAIPEISGKDIKKIGFFAKIFGIN